MGRSLTHQLVGSHLVAGTLRVGEEVAIRVDQVLLTDTNGPLAWLEFEALGADRVVPPLVVTYVDHNVVQSDPRNADDHRYLATASRRYGAVFSKPGHGICHQVHAETFAIPGQSLLGTDSHTPLAGALGMLALGAGGLDVAAALAGAPYAFGMPAVVRVWITGELGPWVTAKDVMLELLGRLTVRGGAGRIFEYTGPGLANLSMAARMTLANMGTELGLTTSVFPSDGVTRAWLQALGRESAWRPLEPDPDADYDDELRLDLSAVGPRVALPGSPDRVVDVGEVAGTPVEQVMVGSCTNSAWEDLASVAAVVRGRRVHPTVAFVVYPGSRRVLETLARHGALADLLAAGALVAEPGCGACPGLSHLPAAGTRSLRAFNRNFPGRSGVAGDRVYLCSSLVAAASALTGVITDPRRLGTPPPTPAAVALSGSEAGFVWPDGRGEVVRGGHMADVPIGEPPGETFEAPVVLCLGDHVSTDEISPSGAAALALRTNIPALAEHSFRHVDPSFAARARAAGRSIVVAGAHYGQGSSREVAAVAPMALGVRVILAESFARIHRANLINWGVVPLTFDDPSARTRLRAGDRLRLQGLRSGLAQGRPVGVVHLESRAHFTASCPLTPRERDVLLAGGRLARLRAERT